MAYNGKIDRKTGAPQWRVPTTRTQAERVIAKFGGVRRFCRLMKQILPNESLNPTSVYRWNYPVEKGGSGGVIPNRDIPLIQKIALADGVFLTQEDLYPGPITRREWGKRHDGSSGDL